MFRRLLFTLLHPCWRLVDALLTKRPDHWAFATHHLHTDRFIENQRALFEHVKNDSSIRKIIFYRGLEPDLQIEGGIRHEAVRLGTLRSFLLLARCRVVLVTHSITMDFSLRWSGKRFSILKLDMRRRLVVNLWHGIPLKRLLYAANEATLRHTDRVRYRHEERKHYAGLIASSDIDSYAMAAMFYPLNYRQIWLTGLPRNDFLLQPESALPRYIRDSLQRLNKVCGGRRLVVYAPTYRQTDVADDAWYYQFSDDEIARLKEVLTAHNAVLGYRPHYFRNSSRYFNMDRHIDGHLIIDVAQTVIPEFSALARVCDLLVTDYSSVYIETLYLGKPAICFGYDIEHYRTHQDGLLYDLSLAFPGPLCTTFDSTLAAIERHLAAPPNHNLAAVQEKIFFRYRDDQNSERVRQCIQRHLATNSAERQP